MACETLKTNLNARTAAIAVTASDVAAAGNCAICGGACCNCTLCVFTKGRMNLCAPCFRAAKKGDA